MATKKFNEVRNRHSNLRIDIFTRLYEADWTPTKKYFEYMVKMWGGNRYHNGIRQTKLPEFVRLIKKYDELLPYIQDKDIYDAKYLKFTFLRDRVQEAELTKIEKTFVKEDHVAVIEENEDWLMVRPKTHVGSLKYGAGTRWCTASKHNPHTFNSYSSSGILVYVIDKSGKRTKNFEKLAFYFRKKNSIRGDYSIFNSADNSVAETTLMNNGWNFDDLMLLDLHARNHVHSLTRLDMSKQYVKTTLDKIKTIDFTKLSKEINFLNKLDDEEDYFKESKVIVDKFLAQMEDFSWEKPKNN